ncbi:hypothetical protein EIP91_007678 [Steccherinum ochraceum]|uniref:Uncharacterized protein n=1 Tax=Steccherinum ochraceum TaxID=92696 RepID=A0A4V2MVD7_9APHY|nr:hypothetical protein EIP91_007678 [Steccherinum ochraceum]
MPASTTQTPQKRTFSSSSMGSSKPKTTSTITANGSVFIAGVAVLEHLRFPTGKSRTMICDAQLYMEEEVPMTVGFKYFNSDNILFEDAVNIVFLVATVVTYDKSKFQLLHSEVLGEDDYDLIGEICMLIPAGTEDRPVNPCVPPLGIIAGPVTSQAGNNEEFNVDVTHWTQPGGYGQFATRGYFGATNRHANSEHKPLPRPGTIAAFAGRFTHTLRPAAGTPERFLIDVDYISFIGQSQIPPKSAPSTGKGKETPAKRFGFSFGSPTPRPSKKSKVEEPAPLQLAGPSGLQSDDLEYISPQNIASSSQPQVESSQKDAAITENLSEHEST